ncbi:MAG TPA: GNAT family N-acetyltransferase [Ktedonobacterales bacterium]
MVNPEAQDLPLATARLLLEPLIPAHAPALHPLLLDARLYTYIPEDPPSSLEVLVARYRHLASRHSPDGREVWLNWAARLRAASDFVGTFQATVQPDRTALLAYMIFTPYQREGYAREGCDRVIEHLVHAYGVRQIVAEIDTRNRASIALVETLGFVRVAERPAADFFKGAVSDEYRYEYRPEFP